MGDEENTPIDPPGGSVRAAAARWPVRLTTGAFLATVAFLTVRVLAFTDGRFVYTIDDPAIHLSMAENLWRNGTWGVAPGTYESASSAPLWTLVLSPFAGMLGSAAEALPFVLNVVAAVLILRTTTTAFTESTGWRWHRSFVSIAFLLVLPLGLFLPTLVFVGMEHLWHAFVVLSAFIALDRLLGDDRNPRALLGLAGLLAIATGLRLETVFVAAGCALAFALADRTRAGRDRARPAFVVLAASAVPAIAIGLVNLAFGQGLLPNSIVLKTAADEDPGFLPTPSVLFENLATDPLLAVLLAAAIVYLAFAAGRAGARHRGFAIAWTATVVAHLLFADVGWWDRYQEYLIVSGVYLVLVIGLEVVPVAGRSALLVSLTVILVVMAGDRWTFAMHTPRGASNTYRQQVQVGEFFDRYYDGRAVAVNDLGWPSYLHDGPIVDLAGLGTREVLDAMRDDRLTRDLIGELLTRRKVEVLVVHPKQYFGLVPEGWILVGLWDLQEDRITPLDDKVAFFAPDVDAAVELRRQLEEFDSSLPSRVDLTHPMGLVLADFEDLRDRIAVDA